MQPNHQVSTETGQLQLHPAVGCETELSLGGGLGDPQQLAFELAGLLDTPLGFAKGIPFWADWQVGQLRALAASEPALAGNYRVTARTLAEFAEAFPSGRLAESAEFLSYGGLALGGGIVAGVDLAHGDSGAHAAAEGIGSTVGAYIGGSLGAECGIGAVICVPVGAAAGGWAGQAVGGGAYDVAKSVSSTVSSEYEDVKSWI